MGAKTETAGPRPDLPVWRSLLYVPANNRRFIDKAHTRNADGIILDLEDGVPPGERPGAREVLDESVAKVGTAGADVLGRVKANRRSFQPSRIRRWLVHTPERRARAQ